MIDIRGEAKRFASLFMCDAAFIFGTFGILNPEPVIFWKWIHSIHCVILYFMIADGNFRRYVEDTGDSENVYVVRNGEKLYYSALAKEVETSPTASV